RPVNVRGAGGGGVCAKAAAAGHGPAPGGSRAPLRRHDAGGLAPVSEKVAVYPGSFDPFTNGHLDVVDRALSIFDRVVVAVAANPDKRQPLFTVEERLDLIRASLAGRERVEVASYQGLTVEYARSRGARTLVKGLRAYSDFDAELQQALMNRKL